jgi:HPt (histidine-containing phosphotransfer) domain-containing protein
VDLSVLEGLSKMLGREKVLFYVRSFSTDAVRINAEIDESASLGDLVRLQAAAHKLKGVAGSVGITLVATRADAIDMACKKGQLETALTDVPELARDLDAAIDALRAAFPDAFE